MRISVSQKPKYECSGKLSDGCEHLDLGWACPEIALGCCPMCYVGIRSVRCFGVGMGENW